MFCVCEMLPWLRAVASTSGTRRKDVRASDMQIFCILPKNARTSVRVTVQTRHLLRLQQLQRGSTQTRNRRRGKVGAGRGRRSRTTSLTMTSTMCRTANVFQPSIRYLRSMPCADDAELALSASSGPECVFVDPVSIPIDAPDTYQRTFIFAMI